MGNACREGSDWSEDTYGTAELGEARKDPLQQVAEGAALPAPGFQAPSQQNCETMDFCCSKLPNFGNLEWGMAAPGNSYKTSL